MNPATVHSTGLLVLRLEVGATFLALVGLARPLVAAALTADMLVALITTHIGHGFFVADGGAELVILLGLACVAIALAGPGRFSVDAAARIRRIPLLATVQVKGTT